MSQSATAPTYRIVGVWDLLEVPEDRLAACLAELTIALNMTRSTLALLGRDRWEMGPFTWRDDNKGEVTVGFSGR